MQGNKWLVGFCLYSEGRADGLDRNTVMWVGWGEEPTALESFGPESVARVNHEGKQVNVKTPL